MKTEKQYRNETKDIREFNRGKADALHKRGCLSSNGSYLEGYEVGLDILKESK